jgi:MFS family permease
MTVLGAVADSFSVLRNRNFRVYLGGQAVSLVGTWLQTTAQGWVVWRLTGSTVDLGVTTMLVTLPLLLLAPWTGSLADRYNRRKLLMGTQLAAMTLAFVLAFLVLTGAVRLWHVYTLGLLLGIVTALDMPTQQAFVGDLAGTGEVRKAVNVNGMIAPASRLVGPALAGIVIGLFGAGIAFLLNGISFMAVVASLAMVRQAGTAPARRASGNALRGFGEALRFIRSQPRLACLIVIVMLVTFFGTPIVVNILPAVATRVLGGDASTLGALMSASGAGALVGTVLFAPWARTFNRTGIMLVVAAIASALSFMALGASHVQVFSMAALFIAGSIAPSMFVTVVGLLQFNSPLEMRARIMSLFTMVSYGLQPIAALWIGWSADHFGIEQAILVNASLMLAGALVMLSRPSLRGWGAAQPAAAVAPLGKPGD